MQTDTRREATVPARQRLVWQVLSTALTSVVQTPRPARVLDCGGGSGSFAVPLAQLGADVTVVDISVDALATLHRRAVEAGVAERVRPVQGDVEALIDVVPLNGFDLVLAHGILEEVEHILPTFEAIAASVRPGGLLSVLVGNPVAVVLARALSGDLAAALAELRSLGSDDTRPSPAGIAALCRAGGLTIEQTHGVGVFSELVPGSALDAPGAAEALADLEAESAVQAPFSEIASRVHTLARRPR